MYNVIWIDWQTGKEHSMRLKASNVARFIALLISDVKPNSIRVEVTV